MRKHVQRSFDEAATRAAKELEKIGDEYDAIARHEGAGTGLTRLKRVACLAQATATVLGGSKSPSRHSQSPPPRASSPTPSNRSGPPRGEKSARAGASRRRSSSAYLTVSSEPAPSPGGQRTPFGHARTPSGNGTSTGPPSRARGRSPTDCSGGDSLPDAASRVISSYTSSRDRRAKEWAFQPRTPSASPPGDKDAGKPPKPFTRVDTVSTDGNPNNSPPRTKGRIMESRNGSPERPIK